jgi:putative aldouronate transport system permease protein
MSKLNVLDVYAYKMGIAGTQYSFAVAISIFKSAVSIILLFTANTVMKKVTGRSIT